MSNSVRGVFDTVRTTAFGGIGANFTLVGTLFGHQVRLLDILNNTNQTLIISDDGVNDKMYFTAGMGRIFDISANRADPSGQFTLGEGDGIWVRHAGVAPTAGAIYVSIIYGRGE